ncbi:MAG TPA: ATP synthase F1 subunit delta [Ignavibacteria bacterium]|nr:ATP synthase F1 subunit delta [Ignavibacteria bacterium]
MFNKINRRYILALYQDALLQNNVNQVTDDATFILNTLKGSRELQVFFKSPVIDAVKKEKIVKSVFEGKIQNNTLNFILILIQRGREMLIKSILEDFIIFKNEKNGFLNVDITTAVEISDEEKKNLKSKIDEYTKLNTIPNFSVDNKLIGGFVVKIKDTILDASIKRQLELLKKRFKEGEIILN